MKNNKTKFLVIEHPETNNKMEKNFLAPVRNATNPRKSFDNISNFKNPRKFINLNLPVNKNISSICSPMESKSNNSKRPSVPNSSYSIHKSNNDTQKLQNCVSNVTTKIVRNLLIIIEISQLTILQIL